MPSDAVERRQKRAGSSAASKAHKLQQLRNEQKQNNSSVPRPSADVNSLYPKTGLVFFWALVASVRVGVLGALATIFMHPLVLSFAEKFNLSDKQAFFVIGLGLHSIMVFGYSLFFAVCDKFKLLQQYKVNRDENTVQNEKGLAIKALLFVVFYHAVIRYVLCEALWMIFPYESLSQWSTAPSFTRLFVHFFIQYYASEVFNYGFHKATHEVALLKSWHKPHHEFTESEAFAAEYSGVGELSIYTVVSYLHTVHCLPMTVHFITQIWKIAENIEVHSGYCFKGSLLSRLGLLYAYRTEIHDFHHSHPHAKGCYGKPIWPDVLMKTADDYLLYLNQKGETIMDW